MKVIEPNPIIWGYKAGYTVPDIADGLGLSDYAVRTAISAYEEGQAVREILLRRPVAEGVWSRFAHWKREVLGARAALAAIEFDRLAAEDRRAG